ELFTAVIQRNFSSGSICAIGPLFLLPETIFANDSKFSFNCSKSNSLQKARIFSSGIWYSKRIKRLRLLNKINPTLMNSSRSTFGTTRMTAYSYTRSEEHTSELQSRENLVCRLLLEKKT